jgi:hypothetical protein
MRAHMLYDIFILVVLLPGLLADTHFAHFAI